MGLIEILLIGLGLSMDAFAVAIGKGFTLKNVTLRHSLLTGVWFGGFQAIMPIIGFLLARSFSGFITNIDHWVAFGLLILIGGNMIREAIWGEDDEAHNNDFSVRTMFIMAVATSIDALAVGVSMAFINTNIWHAATAIGLITFALSAMGVYIGRLFGSKIGSKSGIVGGIILIGIGVKILIEHLLE